MSPGQTGFVPGTKWGCPRDKLRFSPYFTHRKPSSSLGQTQFVPGTFRGRRAAERVYVLKVYVLLSFEIIIFEIFRGLQLQLSVAKCTKIARFSAVAAAIFTAPRKIARLFDAPSLKMRDFHLRRKSLANRDLFCDENG